MQREVDRVTTKEFSNAFDMTVNEMCEFLGLSRQGLNEIVTGRSTKESRKKRRALHDLRDYAIEKMFDDVKKADARYKERLKLEEIFNANYQ